MSDFDMNGYALSPELDLDGVDVVITPENFKDMNMPDNTQGISFFFNKKLYTVDISLIDIDALKSGETLRRKAYHRP